MKLLFKGICVAWLGLWAALATLKNYFFSLLLRLLLAISCLEYSTHGGQITITPSPSMFLADT